MPTVGDLVTLAIEKAQIELIDARNVLGATRVDFAYQLFLAVAARLNNEPQYDHEPLNLARSVFRNAQKRVDRHEYELARLTLVKEHLDSPSGETDLAKLEQDLI
jgi:hypothetical protein